MKKRTFRSGVLLILSCLILSMGTKTYAAVVNNGAEYPITTNEREGWPKGPEVHSETAVLMEAETGTVLFDKGMDEYRYPASTTKIMTALVALENSSLDDTVTFTETILPDQAPGSGNFNMQVGEQLSMKDCLMLLMIRSANDVATQIAEYVGGSVEGFAQMMNQKAAELGCVNTHFVNASGMPDEDHYTTAYDLALIFREAVKKQEFRDIIGTVSYTIPPTNMTAEERQISTHHALLSPVAPEFYEGCFGGKTGITDAARNTLVSGAERNGMTLIAVAMRSGPGEVCEDHIHMFDYGFDNFQMADVPGGRVLLPAGWSVEDYEKRDVQGEDGITSQYYYPGDLYMGCGSEPAAEPETVSEPEITDEPKEAALQIEEKKAPEDNNKTLRIYKMIILCMLAAVGLVFVITVAAFITKKKKKHKKIK